MIPQLNTHDFQPIAIMEWISKNERQCLFSHKRKNTAGVGYWNRDTNTYVVFDELSMEELERHLDIVLER